MTNHRTALITAALVAVAVFGGAAAIGINLGILNAAEASSVGQLSATDPEEGAATATVLDVTGTQQRPESPQTYIVDEAGTVEVSADWSRIWVTGVIPREGWQYRLVQNSDQQVVVTFERGERAFRFSATLANSGEIKARVDEPLTRAVAAPGASPPSASGVQKVTQPTSAASDDHDDDDDYREDDHQGRADDD